jgi:hypothetical protein
MTSVVMRALGLERPRPENDYQPNAALRETGPEPPSRARPAERPLLVPAEAHPPGETPLVETAEPQVERPTAPAQAGLAVEVAVAPRSGSPTLDVLLESGYTVVDGGTDGTDAAGG